MPDPVPLLLRTTFPPLIQSAVPQKFENLGVLHELLRNLRGIRVRLRAGRRTATSRKRTGHGGNSGGDGVFDGMNRGLDGGGDRIHGGRGFVHVRLVGSTSGLPGLFEVGLQAGGHTEGEDVQHGCEGESAVTV